MVNSPSTGAAESPLTLPVGTVGGGGGGEEGGEGTDILIKFTLFILALQIFLNGFVPRPLIP
jgi:hypothetical protein